MSAVFEKLGYDAQAGVEIFNSVCASLASQRAEKQRDRARSGDYTEELKQVAEDSTTSTTDPLPDSLDQDSEGGEYRMDLDDFITAAVEIDDSLIQAIQLISRKKIFRMLKQRGTSLSTSGQGNSTTVSSTPPAPPIEEDS